jgi:hypothetical protein
MAWQSLPERSAAGTREAESTPGLGLPFPGASLIFWSIIYLSSGRGYLGWQTRYRYNGV